MSTLEEDNTTMPFKWPRRPNRCKSVADWLIFEISTLIGQFEHLHERWAFKCTRATYFLTVGSSPWLLPLLHCHSHGKGRREGSGGG